MATDIEKAPEALQQLVDMQVGVVKFGSQAKRSGFEPGWDVSHVQVPTDRPSKYWFFLPGFLLAALVWWLQGRRMRVGGARLTPRSA